MKRRLKVGVGVLIAGAGYVYGKYRYQQYRQQQKITRMWESWKDVHGGSMDSFRSFLRSLNRTIM